MLLAAPVASAQGPYQVGLAEEGQVIVNSARLTVGYRCPVADRFAMLEVQLAQGTANTEDNTVGATIVAVECFGRPHQLTIGVGKVTGPGWQDGEAEARVVLWKRIGQKVEVKAEVASSIALR
ncbi:hypothetical protein [Crossiella cryophila]|uniref:Uncharacterized protein n=1 Tax=Crossiella cryophila TaxID=43355 RepID=A0A7W7CH57_9PSEU|nr:hypothetical protein [Crossiella cryophila]MBB4679668.1 hypothetical protein [Crossiella cryophila]